MLLIINYEPPGPLDEDEGTFTFSLGSNAAIVWTEQDLHLVAGKRNGYPWTSLS